MLQSYFNLGRMLHCFPLFLQYLTIILFQSYKLKFYK